jgi:hypothetical protein
MIPHTKLDQMCLDFLDCCSPKHSTGGWNCVTLFNCHECDTQSINFNLRLHFAVAVRFSTARSVFEIIQITADDTRQSEFTANGSFSTPKA